MARAPTRQIPRSPFVRSTPQSRGQMSHARRRSPRLFAVADAFDSITSATSYKSPRPIEEAIDEIRAGAGTQFDPSVASAFDRLVAAGEIEVARAA